MRVSRKLPSVIVGLALLCSASVGIASYMSGANIVGHQAEERLMAVAETRRDSLVDTLERVRSTLLSNAQGKNTRAALADFDKGWKKYGEKAEQILIKTYIEDNPHSKDERAELVKAGRKPYDRSHKKFHPVLHQQVKENGLQDLILVNSKGRVVYSVHKRSDFAADLTTESWQNTAIAQSFKAAIEGEVGASHFFDIGAYKANDGRPTSFISTPIGIGKKKIGVLIYQMPTDKINKLLGSHAGLGETGSVFFINSEGVTQNDASRTPNINEMLGSDLNRSDVTSIFGQGSRNVLLEDFSGKTVRAAVVPFSFMNKNYAVVATQDIAEVQAPLLMLRDLILVIAFVSALVAGVVGFFFANSMSGRIRGLSDAMARLADGDTSIDLPAKARRPDEIDDMTETVHVFCDNAIKQRQLEEEQAHSTKANREQAVRVKELIEDFRSEVSTVLRSVSTNIDDMGNVAETLNSIADMTATEMSAASSASDGASNNVQTVAVASEELSSSIQEIIRQIATTSDVVHNAATNASQTNVKIEGLAQAAQRIGDVVNLISDIAEQTNLLALNATIEAARAGESGRGFAVVASEVKELATQTAKATSEIGDQIIEVQTATEDAVAAIRGITETMDEVRSYTEAIASAVEQQSSATGEIASNVSEAANGTMHVAETITNISEKVNDTNASANKVLSSSEAVREHTNKLRQTVDSFLENVSAA